MRTVLITGASSGIGEAFALRYAREGCRLVLIARNVDTLNKVAGACRSLSQQRVKVIALDLNERDAADTIVQQLQEEEIHVDILINNAGFGLWGDFSEQLFDDVSAMVQVHITALLQLTRSLMPGMIQRSHGKIVNIASVYSYAPVPHQAVYAATKAFVLFFSLALADEIKNTGVSLTVICPGVTNSAFRSRANIKSEQNFLSMTPAKVVELSYDAIEKNQLVFVPGRINQCFVILVRILPINSIISFVRWVNRTLRGL